MLNRAIMTSIIGIGTAQFLKIPLNYFQHGTWEWKKLFETGDMPSSHSASVAALTTYVACKKSILSIDFGVSSVFSMIVMYDAMGIRRSAGEIAMAVNDLEEEVETLAEQHPGFYHRERKKKLEEMLGHMPIEVAGGAALGIVIGAISYLTEKGK